MKPIAKGECDACPKTDVDVFEVVGSKMRLCGVCYQAEVKAIEDAKWIDKTLATARVIDSKLELKQDIFNTEATAFSELRKAIQQNELIPADKKDETLFQLVEERIKKYTEVIFAEEQATMVKRNERASWSQQIKAYAETLRADQRERLKKYDINYKSAPITKKEKTTKPVKPAKKPFDKVACAEAAKKYGVPMNMIQMLCTQKNISIEDAAKEMVAMLNPTQA